MTKPLRIIIGVSAVHFVASFGAFWHSLGSSLGRFDSGTPPSLLDRVLDGAVDVLWFPLVWLWDLLGVRGPGLAEWFILVTNSLLWGLAFYGVFTLLARVMYRPHMPLP
jgi:hypothetical protein